MRKPPKSNKTHSIDARLLAEFERVERDPRESAARAISVVALEYNQLARY